MKWIKRTVFLFFSVFLFGCHWGEKVNQLRVGTIAGPETQIMKVAANFAKKRYGLDVAIITFSDYKTPNRALSEGDIDANMFQHLPFLKKQIKAHGYKLASVGRVFLYPMGVYSNKLKSLSDIGFGMKVGIPNDATNEARALLLLQKAGLIRLKKGGMTSATLQDVVSNPKKIKILLYKAYELPKALSKVDVVVMNTNYAIPAGYYPSEALFLEKAGSQYANVLVVRTDEKNELKFKELLQALHSEPVRYAAKEIFGPGAAVPAWSRP